MERLNFIEIETLWGIKSFELYMGDISAMEEQVDLLAFSILSEFYSPTERSVAGALASKFELDLKELVGEAEFDLRENFGCWVSKELSLNVAKRLLCVELYGRNISIKEALENVFVMLSILEAKGIKVKHFALPLLGTGNLKLDANDIINTLLSQSINYLRRSMYLERIKFVELDEEKAYLLNSSMDKVLGGIRVLNINDNKINKRKNEIVNQAKKLMGNLDLEENSNEVIKDLIRIFQDSNRRLFELGIVARKSLELFLNQIQIDSRSNLNLYNKIEEFKKKNKFSEWIPYYMHLIRVFGNNSAHAENKNMRPQIDEVDVYIFLAAFSKVLSVWLEEIDH